MSKNTHSFAARTLSLLLGLSFVLATTLVTPHIGRAAGVLYVAPTAAGSGDCSSWANACILQTALGNAVSSDEIWVMQGVHKPGVARTDTFTLKNGLALYGGFAGTETSLDERDWTANITVLSGDIDDNDITDPNGVVTDTANIVGANAYKVVFSSGVTETAVLDGFVITAGQADNDGGGMYNYGSSPALTNVTFSGNSANRYGGGMANYYNSNPALRTVTFSSNHAIYNAGGMFNSGSSPTLTDVTFSNNSAYHGSGMHNGDSSSPTLTNVTFSGNSADHYGGGMTNYDQSNPTLMNVTFSSNNATYGGGMDNYASSPTLTNVTFSGNSADYGGGMHNNGNSSPALRNVILWGDSAPSGPEIYNNFSTAAISYSDVQGCGGSGAGWQSACGTDGGGNIDDDPLFVNAAGGDLRLILTSPTIDAGNNAAVLVGVTTDLDGKPRFVDIATVPDTGSGTPPIVDMGAYEASSIFLVHLPVVNAP